jgi:hypothetical protein
MAFAAVPAWANGTIVKLEGSAKVGRKGQAVPVTEAAPLYSGDSLDVAEHSKAQVHFEDDSMFAIPGATQLRVDEFRMPSATGGGKAIYTLQSGGFRTITGRISKNPNDQYELRTEQATITVQGSSYSTMLCTKQCGKKHRPGLYVKAESGVIILTNSAGQMRLTAGKVAFVESSASAAVAVKVSPFNDPALAADYAVDVEFDTEVHPPRIEQEPPASPS